MIMKKGILLILVTLVISACAVTASQDEIADKEPSGPIDVSGLIAEANGDEIVLDLYDVDGDVAYYIAPELDLSKVTIICPNGQTMPLLEWASVQSEANGIDLLNSPSGFVMSNSEDFDSSLFPFEQANASKSCVIIVCSDGVVVVLCDAE